MSQASPQPCPIVTHAPVSLQESLQGEVPEIRAYKLGKRRWSYNQVELVLVEAGQGGRVLTVKQAVNMGTDNFKEEVRESSVSFQVQMANEYRVQVHAFLCYDSPALLEAGGSHESGDGSKEGGAAPEQEDQYQWALVDRSACQKGCCGPVLRAIQRFGKLGKRAWGTTTTPDLTDRTNNNMKDPRYFYLSFDEAGTHVGVKAFRLVVAVYDQGGRRRLSTCVSAPIRVLANNDVPTGAAHIMLHAQIPSSWEGWAGVLANPAEQLPMLPPPLMPVRPLPVSRMAASPMLATPANRPRPSSSADSADHSHHSSSGGEKRLRTHHQARPEDGGAYLAMPGAGRYHGHGHPAHHAHGHAASGALPPGTDRRTKRRLSLGQDDPDYVPGRSGVALYADATPARLLPPRRHTQMEMEHLYDDSTPSGTPTQSLPSPGATNSNTSQQLLGAGAAQPGASLVGTFSLQQHLDQTQQLMQVQQGGRRGAGFGAMDMDHFPLGLQGLEMDMPQFLQAQPLLLGAGSGRPSPSSSPYQQASPSLSPVSHPSTQQASGSHQQQHFPGLFVGQRQQELGLAGPPHGRQEQQRMGLGSPQQGPQQQQPPPPLSLSPNASHHLLMDLPGSGGSGHLGLAHLQLPQRSLAFPLGATQPSLDASCGDDPITAFLEVLTRTQPTGPGSPVIELPNLSPGGSPTKSPFRRQGAGGFQLGPSPLGGGNPSSLSNATAFLPGIMLPSSPLSPQQQQQGVGMQRPPFPLPHMNLPTPVQLQQHSRAGQQAQQQQHGQQHDQHLSAFGSTINLFLEGGNGKARQAAGSALPQQQASQQQQHPDLFFRRGPGLTTLGMDQALANMRMSPLHGKMDPSLMAGMEPSPIPPLSPPRMRPGSDLSPLRMAHSPNSISTPTPSALDDIFNSFQPTLETAAEALMHGESAFAAPSIKAEPGVSSGVMMVGQGPSSLAVQ